MQICNRTCHKTLNCLLNHFIILICNKTDFLLALCIFNRDSVKKVLVKYVLEILHTVLYHSSSLFLITLCYKITIVQKGCGLTRQTPNRAVRDCPSSKCSYFHSNAPTVSQDFDLTSCYFVSFKTKQPALQNDYFHGILRALLLHITEGEKWSKFSNSSTGSKVRAILYRIIYSTAGKNCSIKGNIN